GYVRQWSSGFTRHVPRDVTAPSTPSGLSGTGDVEGVTLGWQASTDDRGVTAYEVLRDDRVVATVAAAAEPSATLPPAGSDSNYFVRAVDAQGNKSASTEAVQASELPTEPLTETYV